ncbi:MULTISPECIES: ABC transporter substrate-binding protein [unclassified Polynucleobacter]|uniref:ABC transporter substrate-binding protein n=1 Tax=unclassified Polynucleobacter TaxID=2640945 RepID=UPI0024934B62|nr:MULTISPECIES: ABC transporter substrate-binding protein [unclassified Polynucleobacter]
MMKKNKFIQLGLVVLSGLMMTIASAQTVKIGFMGTYSGPGAAQGDQLDKGVKLFIKLNGDKLPPGVKVEIITRDDTGPNPDVAKRVAQELIVREKVNYLTGFVWSPNMAAIGPLTTEAKVPYVSMNAAAARVMINAPYMARTSFTLWQSAYPLGQWAAKKYKKAYTAVSDFAPGHEAEEGFIKGFKEGGGEILGSVRIPVANPDFTPFIQKIKDVKPDVIFGFNPAGKAATGMMKAYSDLGLAKAGIKFIGTGDIVTDEELQGMGDVALGVTTVHHYSANSNRASNRAFVAAYKKEFGENLEPGFMAVGAWDAMEAIFYTIREQNGKIDPDKTMELLKKYKSTTSPRGEFSIDPETRDVINPEYLREVRKVNGKLANVEIETLSTGIKDPMKEFDKKK